MVYGDEALAEQFKTQNCIDNHDFIMRHSNQIESIIKSPVEE